LAQSIAQNIADTHTSTDPSCQSRAAGGILSRITHGIGCL
jgi:hypothetical protein